MRRLLASCLAIAGLAGRAHADADADALARLVKAQVKAMTAPDADAFAASFDADAFAVLSGGYANGPRAIGKAMACSWSNPEGTYYFTQGKTVIGRQGDVAWVTADLTMTSRAMDSPPGKTPFRMTELLTREGAAWKAHALYVSAATADLPSSWTDPRELAGDSPAGAATADAPMLGWLAHPADLAAHLRKGTDVIVLGSAPGERGGASLLASWKKLTFAVDWSRAGGDGKTWAWLVARVSRDAKAGKVAVKEPYWLLALAVRGAADWEIVSLHYGQDHPEPDDLPGGCND
jgi:ketosteroid isomerase-like protein